MKGVSSAVDTGKEGAAMGDGMDVFTFGDSFDWV